MTENMDKLQLIETLDSPENVRSLAENVALLGNLLAILNASGDAAAKHVFDHDVSSDNGVH